MRFGLITLCLSYTQTRGDGNQCWSPSSALAEAKRKKVVLCKCFRKCFRLKTYPESSYALLRCRSIVRMVSVRSARKCLRAIFTQSSYCDSSMTNSSDGRPNSAETLDAPPRIHGVAHPLRYSGKTAIRVTTNVAGSLMYPTAQPMIRSPWSSTGHSGR